MYRINIPVKRFLIFSFIILSITPLILFSQDHANTDDNFLGAPDTIVYVSEEDLNYSEEYLMIHFTAVDEGERFPVPAHFKIFHKENNTPLSGAAEDRHTYQATLVSNEEYLIEVKALGYELYSESFSLKSAPKVKDLHKVIPLEKSNFMINIRAVDGITGEAIKNAAITLVNTAKNKTIHTMVNPETGDCRADFELHSEYKVEVNASGFNTHYEDFEIHEKINSKDFVLYSTSSPTFLKINVVEAKTHKPIVADIKLVDWENNEIPLKWKKDYAEAKIHIGAKYKIRAKADGYENYDENLAVESHKENKTTIKLARLTVNEATNSEELLNEPESTITFENIEPGISVVMNNIFFDQSKFTLKENSYEELDKLVNTLRKNPQYNILISGHTDNQGNKKLNQMLSLNRAKVIANYLIENGIREDRLEVVGYGSDHPIAPNDVEENRMKNRRVEFTIK